MSSKTPVRTILISNIWEANSSDNPAYQIFIRDGFRAQPLKVLGVLLIFLADVFHQLFTRQGTDDAEARGLWCCRSTHLFVAATLRVIGRPSVAFKQC